MNSKGVEGIKLEFISVIQDVIRLSVNSIITKVNLVL